MHPKCWVSYEPLTKLLVIERIVIISSKFIDYLRCLPIDSLQAGRYPFLLSTIDLKYLHVSTKNERTLVNYAISSNKRLKTRVWVVIS